MKKRLYASPDKKLCGLCGGVADYLNLDPTLIRAVVACVAWLTAVIPALVVYFIMALVIPKAPDNYYQIYNNTSKKITKGSEKKIFGVCSGIAEYCNADPTIIRLIFALVFLFFGYGLAIYIICAVVFPQNQAYDGGYYESRPPYGANGNAQYAQQPFTDAQSQNYSQNFQNGADFQNQAQQDAAFHPENGGN